MRSSGAMVATLVATLVASAVLLAAAAQQPTRPGGDRWAAVPPAFRFLFDETQLVVDVAPVWAALPFDSITLERTRCFGSCPAYRVTFHRGRPKPGSDSYEDVYGMAELQVTFVSWDKDTRRFPDATGSFEGRVDLWTFARLSYLIQKSGLQLLDRYDSKGTDDHASATVSVSGPTISKSVVDYGDVGPIELWGIREAIDSAAKSIKWKRQKSRGSRGR